MVTSDKPILPIDVSSLGSFVFCQRAGVIAFKKQGVDEFNEEEPRIPNLSYLPEFSEAELQERFEKLFPTLVRYSVAILIWFLIVALLAKIGSILLSFLLLVAMMPLAVKTFNDIILMIAILAELSRYKNSSATPLDSTATQPIKITWHGLISAGYTPIKPGSAIKDPELDLNGRPWRVLSNNDGVRIPVINSNSDELVIRDSHRIRLAAYCHLLDIQQKATADWGVVLDMKTKNGYAIPIGVVRRSEALAAFGRFRQVLEKDLQQIPLKIPVDAPCQNCRFGKPRLYVKGSSETTYRSGPIGANVENGHGNTKVHSDCGDEFEWRPLHNYWLLK